EPEGRTARRTERPLTDELEALRLEMEALRKEVRATRSRVQALEAEVRDQKGKNTNLRQSAVLNGQYSKSSSVMELEGTSLPQTAVLNERYIDPSITGLTPAANRNNARSGERPYDVFAEAEAALKKLRVNPRDKEAAHALEQATQRLKARTETQGTETNILKKQ